MQRKKRKNMVVYARAIAKVLSVVMILGIVQMIIGI